MTCPLEYFPNQDCVFVGTTSKSRLHDYWCTF
uniref:Uncharacterized protein n=1 Tax=Rhizophora mucronata TaxID=61149 RepID=A0A2P2P7G7_RHIMU